MHNSCVMHCDNARPLEYHWPIGRRKIFSLDDLHLHQIKSSSKWRLGPKMRLILPSLPLHLHPSLTLPNSPHLSSFLFNPFCARNTNSINVSQLPPRANISVSFTASAGSQCLATRGFFTWMVENLHITQRKSISY
jgi:hypothetical protein